MHCYIPPVRVLFLLLILSSFLPEVGRSQQVHPEVTRTRGFSEYKRQKSLAGREREKDYGLHLEKLEHEKQVYAESLEEYRKIKRKEKPLEYTPAYTQSKKERAEDLKQYAEDREEFRYERKVEKRLLEQAHLNKMEELGLPEDRPRFDLNKRSLYGATPKFGKPSGGSIGGSSSFTPSPDTGSSNNYSPPPPSFDDFPPPPSFPGEDNFDLPPPPPPMPYDDGASGMNAPFDDFPPPPPPPPIDDFQF